MKRALLLVLILTTVAGADWDADKPADSQRYDLRDDDTRTNFAYLESLLSNFADMDDDVTDVNMPKVYNVVAYGAVVDDGLDDSTAIEAAITACPQGGTVYFPVGVYQIATPLTFKGAINYRGDGPYGCRLNATAANTDTIFTFAAVNIVTMRGLSFSSSNALAYGFKSTDLTEYVDDVTIRDCEFYASLHTCFYGTTANTVFQRVRWGYLGTPNGTHRHFYGGDVTEATYIFTTRFDHCWFHHGDSATDTDACVQAITGSTVTFTSCVWQECDIPAYKSQGIRNTTFNSCDYEAIEPSVAGEYDALIVMDPTPVNGFPGNVTLNGCWFQNNGHTATWDITVRCTTSGADSHASFNGCSGNFGGAYWTQTGGVYDKPGSTRCTNNNVTNNSNSDFDQTGGVGRPATFYSNIGLRNGAADENRLLFTGQSIAANAIMYPVYTEATDLTNVNIKALVGTPIELVAAQGADTLIEVISAVLTLNYGTNALTEPSNPDDLAIEYDGGSGAQIITWDTTAFITAAADTIEQVNVASIVPFTKASNVNKNVVLINTGTDYTGNAGANTTMRVIVTYRLHTSLGF